MLMKTTCIKSLLSAALMLGFTCISCDDEKADVTQPDNNPVWEVEAYLPSTFADKTVSAWYSVYSETDYKKKIEAVFLFSDSTFIVTKSKTYSQEDGRNPSREVMYHGTYHVLEGDFDNGNLEILLPGDFSLDAGISDSELTLMAVTYIRQDNAAIPDPIQTTQELFTGKMEAYLPAFTIEFNYAAWYQHVAQDYNQTRIDAIFLSTDSLMLYTSSVFYTSGRQPAYELLNIGKYKIAEGDFTNGKLNLWFRADQVYETTVTQGEMPARNMIFTQQDIANLPAPIKL